MIDDPDISYTSRLEIPSYRPTTSRNGALGQQVAETIILTVCAGCDVRFMPGDALTGRIESKVMR